jgi:hypothetical protein
MASIIATTEMTSFIFHQVENNDEHNVNMIYDFYHNVCKNTFDSHELEDYQKWIEALDNNNIKNIYTHFIIITENNKVIGGIVNEIYKKSICSLVSYIAIDKKFRGSFFCYKLYYFVLFCIHCNYIQILCFFIYFFFHFILIFS